MESSPLEKEANDRLYQARKNKVEFDVDFREAYTFAAPHRARNVLSTVPTPDTRPQDAAKLNSSFAFELAADFPTVMINTFCPESQVWAVRKASVSIPPEQARVVAEAIATGDKAIFEAIAGSNFHAACGMGFNPDLAIGTVGMWIDRPRPGGPIKCKPVPIRELEINIGPDGDVDDRFVVRWTRNRHLPALLKGLSIPKETLSEIDKKPNDRTQVTWGFWRDWDQVNESWHHVVLIKNKVIHSTLLKGQGSCPLVAARFNPCPEWVWGEGPLIQGIPDLRHDDALAEGKIGNVELGLRPPVSWPDDSWTNIEEGIEPGMAYPVRPGSEAAIKNIYTPTSPDAAIYQVNDLQQRLRRLFFLDWPHQSGDTPPTATQWLDEMTMAQRRIGTPGLVFWHEFCGGTFIRFQHILEKDGIIQPVKVDGKSVMLQPYNPAQRAVEQQDVASFTRFIQIAGAAFPEELKIATDGSRQIGWLAEKLGVDWKRRSAAQMNAAIQQIQMLQGGTPPTGAPAAGGQPQREMAGVTQPPNQVRQMLGG